MRYLRTAAKQGTLLSKSMAAFGVLALGALIGATGYAAQVASHAFSIQQRTMARNEDILTAVSAGLAQRIPRAEADAPGGSCGSSCSGGSSCSSGGGGSSCSSSGGGCFNSGCGTDCAGGTSCGGFSGCSGCASCSNSTCAGGCGCSCG